jgi:hypothetical protein
MSILNDYTFFPALKNLRKLNLNSTKLSIETFEQIRVSFIGYVDV